MVMGDVALSSVLSRGTGCKGVIWTSSSQFSSKGSWSSLAGNILAVRAIGLHASSITQRVNINLETEKPYSL